MTFFNDFQPSSIGPRLYAMAATWVVVVRMHCGPKVWQKVFNTKFLVRDFFSLKLAKVVPSDIE